MYVCEGKNACYHDSRTTSCGLLYRYHVLVRATGFIIKNNVYAEVQQVLHGTSADKITL